MLTRHAACSMPLASCQQRKPHQPRAAARLPVAMRPQPCRKFSARPRTPAFGSPGAQWQSPQRRRQRRSDTLTMCSLQDTAVGLGIFFTPSILATIYAFYKGKGNFSDGFSRLLTEVSQGYFQPNAGGGNIPTAEGELSDLAGDEPLFKALYKWFIESGGAFKLAFGPKAFIVVSDPVIVRHLLKENASNYDKGVLAEILEPIMGKGLIPADLETWKPRRRAIVPAFHKAYLEAMVRMFGACTQRTVDKFTAATESGQSTVVDMEVEFLNLGLDIIGLGVFNYDFGSITTESPVIQAVYGLLKEAEHRSTFYIPYWNLPLTRPNLAAIHMNSRHLLPQQQFQAELKVVNGCPRYLVPRQRQFRADLKVVDGCLDELIALARRTSQPEDLEALQARDYSKVRDPSLLRFLVDVREADLSDKQLRDDLMTMLIAGHETTAAVLTWTLFLLMQHSDVCAEVVKEVDSACSDCAMPGWEEIRAMPLLRATLAESLRLYPQPPILIRRALEDDILPPGLNGAEGGYPIGKGCDLFISVWNLHRSPHLWKDPDAFRPERFREANSNPDFKGAWAGYRPEAQGSSLYPNEVSSDFAFIPFGGGMRKCVGDQFALTEAVVAMAMMLRKFDFSFAGKAEDVGMATGATIHTANGLSVRVTRRAAAAGTSSSGEQLPEPQPVLAA